jgi:hypothetical protein
LEGSALLVYHQAMSRQLAVLHEDYRVKSASAEEARQAIERHLEIWAGSWTIGR